MKNVKKATSPLTLDSYRTRVDRIEKLYEPDNLYGKLSFVYTVIFILIVIDFFCLFIIWNLVQVENPLYVYFIALGCAIALDLPMAYAAFAIKKYQHGMLSHKEATIVTSVAIAVFIIAFVFSLFFRVVTRDMSFEIGTASTLVDTMGGAVGNTKQEETSIWFASIFNGVIPLLSGLSSFIITYFSYSPLNNRIKIMELERIRLQSNILDVEKAIAEAENADIYCSELVAREHDSYYEFIDKLDTESQFLKQLARVVIMQNLKTSSMISAVTESSKELYSSESHSDSPETELSELIESRLKPEDNYYNCGPELVA